MSIVEGFERKALFNITRAVALVCVTVFLLAVIGGAMYAFSVWKEPITTKVSAKEIVDMIKPVESAPKTAQIPQGAQAPTDQTPELSPLAGFRVPFVLQKYASNEKAQNIIKNHLDELPAADRQDYLDELGAVVTEAEAQKLDGIDAINKYMETKTQRYADAQSKRMQKFEALKLAAMSAAGGLMLVALFSLVLVLLAIERNTRPPGGSGRNKSAAPSEVLPA
jgi:hypothetical protein